MKPTENKIDFEGLLRLWDAYRQADDPQDHRTMALPVDANFVRFRVRAVLEEFDSRVDYEGYCTRSASIPQRLIDRTIRELNGIFVEATE